MRWILLWHALRLFRAVWWGTAGHSGVLQNVAGQAAGVGLDVKARARAQGRDAGKLLEVETSRKRCADVQ